MDCGGPEKRAGNECARRRKLGRMCDKLVVGQGEETHSK